MKEDFASFFFPVDSGFDEGACGLSFVFLIHNTVLLDKKIS